MNILVVSDVSPVAVRGGAERVLWEQASRLVAAGHAVRVVGRAPEGDVAGALIHRGVPVRHFAVDRRSLLSFVVDSVRQARLAVVDEAEQHGADVLHCHQPLAAYGALTSTVGRQLPSLYTFHSPGPLEYRSRRGRSPLHRRGPAGVAGTALLWALERASLKRADRIHVLSDFSAGLLRRLYRIRGERVVKIPGGVDLERFRPPGDRAALRARLGLPSERPVLFTVRNLEPRMGLDTLIRAVDRLRRAGHEALLLIGGEGSLGQELEAMVAALGLAHDVKLLGFVGEGELPLYYAAADAFVLPTRALEGFGLVTVEALACGTPVLGTPVGATPEILGPLDSGLLFRDATVDGIADGLVGFLDHVARDPVTARHLREASRRHAERYDWNLAVERLAQVLESLLVRHHDMAPAPAARSQNGGTAGPP